MDILIETNSLAFLQVRKKIIPFNVAKGMVGVMTIFFLRVFNEWARTWQSTFVVYF